MESRSLQSDNRTSPHLEPRIYTRSEHPVSRKYVSENALKVLYRLDKAGFKAFLVGGSVRDLLLGREPKDFDVATDALPEQVRELFRNCRLIGRRFRLAHVQFGQEIIEVATFRAAHDGEVEGAATTDEGRILRDNVYGDLDDDVWRRDFTVNALYYNIADFSIVDYVGGYEDIKAGRLRLLGDPETRYREDPVRMLRAVRFAVKLGFAFDPATSAPFTKLGHLLEEISSARLFDEVLKLFHGGVAHQTYEVLRQYGLFARLFPLAEATLAREEDNFPHMLIAYALQNTDARIAHDKPVTPAFLFAALLWHAVEEQIDALVDDGMDPNEAFMFAADTVISKQVARIAIPRRFTNVTREIWSLQQRLVNFSPKRAARLVEHPRFRAAYDFLLLRAQAGEAVAEAAEFWTRYLDVPEHERGSLVATLDAPGPDAPRRRRRRRRPPRTPAGE
ncbi:MAG: polynucleotide adenylyltransferase PcnB [Gammaproteobacteria bacterium]|nr:polynucleotide adenylyltransferase PcnB [Gammaproteobacteria bacterium]MBI5617506.1 polynucleotide adenylyltransferase PcnB [Gammaproteobacteria bacterium]